MKQINSFIEYCNCTWKGNYLLQWHYYYIDRVTLDVIIVMNENKIIKSSAYSYYLLIQVLRFCYINKNNL